MSERPSEDLMREQIAAAIREDARRGGLIAFWVKNAFSVVESDRYEYDGKQLTFEAAGSEIEADSAYQDLRAAGSQRVAVAFGLDAIMGRSVSVVEERTRDGLRFRVKIERDPKPWGDPFTLAVRMQNYPPARIAELRARRILLDERLEGEITSFSTEALNRATLEVFVQNRRAPLPALRSPFPLMWRSMQPAVDVAQFIRHARIMGVLFLRLTETVERVERLDLSMPRPGLLSVVFAGFREPDASNVPPDRITVTGEVDLTAREPDEDA